MALNKQLQNIRDKVYTTELEDTKQWNRAKVQECIISAVMMARRLSAYDPLLSEMLATWPIDSSVRYEWFRHIASNPEINIPVNQQPVIESTTNIYRVLALWLHRIDSNMDRTVLILRACGLSFDAIAALYKEQRWKRQTIHSRHTKCLDTLIYDLNHVDELKWPIGIDIWNFK